MHVIRRCGFTANGYGIVQSFSTVWYVGSLTAMPELLPGNALAASAQLRPVLASVVGDWLPLWGAMWSLGEVWACSCWNSGDGMRPAGWFVVRRAFAPRRLYEAKELMALLVVLNMSDIPRLKELGAHKRLVLAGGVRWHRWQLVVRECTG